jgi:hypothetical protein
MTMTAMPLAVLLTTTVVTANALHRLQGTSRLLEQTSLLGWELLAYG